MRRVLGFLICIFLILSIVICYAEGNSYLELSLEELEVMRDQKYNELSLINQEISRRRQKTSSMNAIEGGTSIASLFLVY